MAKKITKTKKPKDPVEKTIEAVKQANDDKLATAVQAQQPSELRVTAKFKEWTALFMDKSNPEYWGNATKCAMKAYNTTSYGSAGQIGHENLKKLEKVASQVMEGERMGFGELMKIGAAKMLKGGYGDWEAFMERLGYFQPKSKGGEGNTFNFENLNVAIMKDRQARGLDQD